MDAKTYLKKMGQVSKSIYKKRHQGFQVQIVQHEGGEVPQSDF